MKFVQFGIGDWAAFIFGISAFVVVISANIIGMLKKPKCIYDWLVKY